MAEKLKITLVKSPIGAVPKHKATVEALGLKKLNKTVEMPDNSAVRGMPVAHIFRVVDSKLGIVVHALSPQHMIFVYIIAIACNHLIRNIIIRNVKIFRLVQ